MDQSQNASYQAGQTKGQAEEKASGMMEKASNAAQGAKGSCQESGPGQQMKSKAQEATDAVKSTLGANK